MADEKNIPSKPPASAAIERARAKAAEVKAAQAKKAATEPRELYLHGFDIGAFPNHLNRSSLIAPIGTGPRKFHHQAVMVTRRDCVLEYTGEQLDEADGDLIMALIAFARPYPLGANVPLNRLQVLRKIKKSSAGKSQYEWLHSSMKRLNEATFFLEARKPDGSTRYSVGKPTSDGYTVTKMASFRILKELDYHEDTGGYTFMLDPRWVILFGNQEYSLIDWDKRMQIKRNLNMAKTLQRLVATSSNSQQRYALADLKAQMAYSSPMRKFRSALEAAVAELARLEIIIDGRIEESTKGVPQILLRLPGDVPEKVARKAPKP